LQSDKAAAISALGVTARIKKSQNNPMHSSRQAAERSATAAAKTGLY
jgi:hypothetical protein